MHPLVDAFIKGRPKFKKLQKAYFDKKGKAACHSGVIFAELYHQTYWEHHKLLSDYAELEKIVPMPCDDLQETEGWILSILQHLNDDHDGRSGWTDKAVATWLEKALTAS